MRVAVIDLGTNTFNLLIVQIVGGVHTQLHRSKVPVKLGEGGIDQNVIQPAAFKRGIDGLHQHMEEIIEYEVDQKYAFATSAIRSADNGQEFIDKAKAEVGLDIEVIDGDREAELICQGVRMAVPFDEKPSLIMDVGGGSTEFIIANSERVFWKQSFPLGVSRLLEKFKPDDPITEDQVEQIKDHLAQQLQPLREGLAEFPCHRLIGSSGSFDSLASMIGYRIDKPYLIKRLKTYQFDLQDIRDVHNELLPTTLEERLLIKGLAEMRADMMVVSSVFIMWVIDNLPISEVHLSKFSLKEGVLSEILEGKL